METKAEYVDMFDPIQQWNDCRNDLARRDGVQCRNELMTFHGNPKHIDRLRQPRLDSNRCLDRIVGSFQAEHSGMLRASSRTNEERNVIALVGKSCSDEPAHRAGSENGVLHDTL